MRITRDYAGYINYVGTMQGTFYYTGNIDLVYAGNIDYPLPIYYLG